MSIPGPENFRFQLAAALMAMAWQGRYSIDVPWTGRGALQQLRPRGSRRSRGGDPGVGLVLVLVLAGAPRRPASGSTVIQAGTLGWLLCISGRQSRDLGGPDGGSEPGTSCPACLVVDVGRCWYRFALSTVPDGCRSFRPSKS